MDKTMLPIVDVAAANRVDMFDLESPRSPRIIIAPFLEKLSQILSTEDPTIVAWSDNGTSFEIHDQERFTEIILPKYFRHNKFASFQRQLNYFGFKKMSKSKSETCTYYRLFFTRDNPENLKLIRRKTAQRSPRAGEIHFMPSAPSPSSMKRPAIASIEPPSKVLKLSHQEKIDNDFVLDVLDCNMFSAVMEDDLPFFDMPIAPAPAALFAAETNPWLDMLDSGVADARPKSLGFTEEDLYKHADMLSSIDNELLSISAW